MAELLLKVGTTVLSDGDIIAAYNGREIKSRHAQIICNPSRYGFNSDGLREPGTVFEDFFRLVYRFKFERTSQTQAVRTDQITQETLNLLDVEHYIKQMTRYHRHAVFGTAGSEVWYGGPADLSDTTLDLVWQEIEAKTGLLESDHRLMTWGRLDVRHHLAVRTVDFSDEERVTLQSPRYELDQNGEPVVDEDGRAVKIAERRYTVDWRSALLDDLNVTEAQVLDRDFPVGVEISARWRSKEQPEQSQREKIIDRVSGGPLQEVV